MGAAFGVKDEIDKDKQRNKSALKRKLKRIEATQRTVKELERKMRQ